MNANAYLTDVGAGFISSVLVARQVPRARHRPHSARRSRGGSGEELQRQTARERALDCLFETFLDLGPACLGEHFWHPLCFDVLEVGQALDGHTGIGTRST